MQEKEQKKKFHFPFQGVFQGTNFFRLPRWIRTLIISGASLVLLPAVCFMAGNYLYSPQKVARDYYEALLSQDWNRMYDCCEFPEGQFLSRKNFVNAMSYGTSGDEESPVIKNYRMRKKATDESSKTSTYEVTYTLEGISEAQKDTVEIARGGQVFILYNRVETISSFAGRIAEIVPEGKVCYAHGRMDKDLLEGSMMAFYKGEKNILVTTTIIENGIDLPDANTLIVVDSGRFGLSQLYQLRGRVGRRGVLAHAYFTVPDNGTLTPDAEKRLRALMENTEIGSGFRIALSDLSIRGAGTLLGAEQHGHIERVGYEMYIELLNEAVEEMRTGRKPEEQREVEMKVDVSAYIRDGYVSGRDKLRIYKRMAGVNSVEERDAVLAELNEVYGTPDEALVNLLNVALLKNLARGFGAARVIVNRNGAGVIFADAGVFGDETLMKTVAAHRSDAVLTNAVPPSLIFDVRGLTNAQKLDKLIAFFREAVSAGSGAA